MVENEVIVVNHHELTSRKKFPICKKRSVVIAHTDSRLRATSYLYCGKVREGTGKSKLPYKAMPF